MKRVTLFKIYQALPTSPVGDPSIYEAFSDFLAEEFEGLEERLSSQVDQGYITFNLLPFLFDPQETIIVTYLSGETWYGSRLRSCRAEIQKNETVLEIESEVFCYDGNHLGRHTRYHQIQNFEGTKRLIDLGTFPLKCHPDKELLENTLLSHGRTYLSLVRQRSCMLHSGCAYSISSESISTLSHNGPVLLGNTDLFHRETGLVPRPTAHLVDLVDDHWREKVTFRDTLECLPFVLAYICFNGKECEGDPLPVLIEADANRHRSCEGPEGDEMGDAKSHRTIGGQQQGDGQCDQGHETRPRYTGHHFVNVSTLEACNEKVVNKMQRHDDGQCHYRDHARKEKVIRLCCENGDNSRSSSASGNVFRLCIFIFTHRCV